MTSGMTIDQLARLAGTTVRQVRALQSQGLVSRPTVVGRTGFYDPTQLERLRAVQRLQGEGFSLAGIAVLLRAFDAGLSLEHVVGIRHGPVDGPGPVSDDEDFSGWPDTPDGRLLSVIPTPLQGLSIAS